MAKYKLQDQDKAMNELKLKADVIAITSEGLVSDKKHLTSELKETRDLQRTYEKKCNELMSELTGATSEF